MTNHYHLLVGTPEGNIALGMQKLNGVYAQTFNRRYQLKGHLFCGRYDAKLIEGEPHLLETLRYIALNPVKAGICSQPEQWPWSSYAAARGLVPQPQFLSLDLIFELFSNEAARARRLLGDFVQAGLERLEIAA
jgi:putative transposase